MAELTEEEGKKLIEAFNKLKIKPKADTAEDLQTWLNAYSGGVKAEPGTALSPGTVMTSQQPRISLFYGDNVKGEATYAQWVYEVRCLLLEKTHKPEAIAQAIRRSLRGEASSIVRRLGIGATITDILHKFDSVYGEVDTKEHLLAKFYSAKQEENEDVTKWSCRLEDILSSAVERNLIDPKNVNDMLRNMFWQGLKPALKDISGYKFERITDFDQLRVEIRKLEQDHFHPSPNVPHCPISKSENAENSELKEMKSMIKSLSNTVQQLEKKINTPNTIQTGNQSYNSNRGRGRGRRRGYYSGFSHPNSDSPNRDISYDRNRDNFNNYSTPEQRQGQGSNFNNRAQNNNYPRRGYNNYSVPQHRQGQRTNFYTNQQNDNYQPSNQASDQRQVELEENDDNFNRGPLCFRCRQYGHFQWNCPVRMDHSRKYLN